MSDLTQQSMSQQRNTTEGEEPNSRKNFFECLPAEIFLESIETVTDMDESPARQLATWCLVSRNFRNVAQPILFQSLQIREWKRMSFPAGHAWVWTKQLASMTRAIVRDPHLARSVKTISLLASEEAADYYWPLLEELDDEPFVPLLLQLQSVAEKTSGTKLRPVAPGDNIVDAFMEALFSLSPNAKVLASLKANGLDYFPRISQFTHDPHLQVHITCYLPSSEPLPEVIPDEYPVFDTTGWEYRSGIKDRVRQASFDLCLMNTSLGTFRHLIQNAAARGLQSLSLSAGKQTEPLDVGDIISTFEASHKTIDNLCLYWYPLDSDNQPNLNISHFSLKALQNLSQLYISCRIFKAATTEDCSACVLPKSLKKLELSGICDDEGLDKLEKLIEKKHLPNLEMVIITFKGTQEKLTHFSLQMKSAGIKLIYQDLGKP